MESKVCSLSHGLALWPGPTSPPAPQKTAFYRPRDTARNSGAPQAAADRRAGGNREMDPPRASAALVNHGLPAKPSAALSYAQGSQKRKEYHVLRNLGAGTKASVKLAKHARTGQLVALKSIRKPVIPDVARRASPKTFQGMAPASGSGPGGQSSAAAGSPSPHNSRDSAAGSSRDVSGAGTNLNGTNGSAGTDAVVSPEREEYALAEKEWRTEVSIMARVGHHENLPTLIDAFETSSKWYIAMTYCQGGDLLSRLLQIEHYSERHAASIMATICNAVHYLHSHGIAHRDLKPANLLMKDETENSNLCIIDFNAGFIVEDPSLMLAHPNSFQSPTPNNFVAKQSMKTVTGNFDVVGGYLAERLIVTPRRRHAFLSRAGNRSWTTIYDHGRHLVPRLYCFPTSYWCYPVPIFNLIRTALCQNLERRLHFSRRYPLEQSRQGLCSQPSCSES